MNEENFEAWVKDLESGEFLQVDGSLTAAAITKSGEEVDGYCCLGVGCLRLDRLPVDNPLRTKWRDDRLAPVEFIKWLDLVPYRRALEGDDDEERFGPYQPVRWDEIDDNDGLDITTLAGLQNDNIGSSAAGLNDSGKSFREIAMWLRANKNNLVAYQ
jgi:hypothetical protein